MFKPLIAFILALFLVLGTVGKPAYAYSDVKDDYSDLKKGMTEFITDNVIKPAVQETVVIFTGAAICAGADTLATSVYPPAGALLTYCPGVGKAVASGVRKVPIRQVMRTALNYAR
jgi:hypothetical protein